MLIKYLINIECYKMLFNLKTQSVFQVFFNVKNTWENHRIFWYKTSLCMTTPYTRFNLPTKTSSPIVSIMTQWATSMPKSALTTARPFIITTKKANWIPNRNSVRIQSSIGLGFIAGIAGSWLFDKVYDNYTK